MKEIRLEARYVEDGLLFNDKLYPTMNDAMDHIISCSRIFWEMIEGDFSITLECSNENGDLVDMSTTHVHGR